MSYGIAEIKNRPVVFTSTFLGKTPLTRQTRSTFNRSRANLNGPIRNTFFFAETNQRQSCSRVLQSSWSLSSTCAEELWVEIVRRCVLKTMYNKTIMRFGFCDILNNQGLGKCYLPRPWLFRTSQKPHPIIVYNQQNYLICLITSMISGWKGTWKNSALTGNPANPDLRDDRTPKKIDELFCEFSIKNLKENAL